MLVRGTELLAMLVLSRWSGRGGGDDMVVFPSSHVFGPGEIYYGIQGTRRSCS